MMQLVRPAVHQHHGADNHRGCQHLERQRFSAVRPAQEHRHYRVHIRVGRHQRRE